MKTFYGYFVEVKT